MTWAWEKRTGRVIQSPKLKSKIEAKRQLTRPRTTVQESDWQPLETIAKQIVKEKQTFERLVVSKTNLLEMFKYSKYKVHFINTKVPDESSTTVYRCGTLIDLCLGPHIRNTGLVKAFAILRVFSTSNFLP